jgi:hypothetical protein
VETTTPHADRYDVEVGVADVGIGEAAAIADASVAGRFDPHTGKLLASAPRFDAVTGKRVPVSHTRVIPAERRVGFLVALGVWGCLMAMVSIGMMQAGFPVVEALFGGSFWFLVGGAVITIISFVYRKLRKLP